jgi:hypothetical protein
MKSRQRPSLTALFAVLNRTHFGGRLPRYTVRRIPLTVDIMLTRELTGLSLVPHHLGYCNARLLEIRIINRLRPVIEREVLLHEMCHAATADESQAGMQHGPLWRQEMCRLATECGERWAEENADAHCQRFSRMGQQPTADEQDRHQQSLLRPHHASGSLVAKQMEFFAPLTLTAVQPLAPRLAGAPETV